MVFSLTAYYATPSLLGTTYYLEGNAAASQASFQSAIAQSEALKEVPSMEALLAVQTAQQSLRLIEELENFPLNYTPRELNLYADRAEVTLPLVQTLSLQTLEPFELSVLATMRA